MKSVKGWWIMVMGLFIMPVFLTAQQLDKSIKLLSIYNNKAFDLTKAGIKLRAIVFLSPECPLSQNYTLALNRLQHEFKGKLTVMGIFPGSAYNDTAYQAFEKKYQVTFPLLKDGDKLLTAKLGATITPEVFLMNESGLVIYSGAIDDWAVKLGKTRRTASEHYLKNAIEHALAGQSAQPDKTKAVGCFIN